MRWLSESVEKLIADELFEKDSPGKLQIHDCVVVGSGYGGAVAALRLAEKRYKVLVLERGDEYLPGEFPNDIANLPSHVRLERWNQKETEGNESGLFDLRIGENVGVLVGSALGGTSQINANVLIEPDPRVFCKKYDEQHGGQDIWPKALKKDKLKKYFEMAKGNLGAADFSGECAKYTALEDLKKILEEKSSKNPPPCLKGCSVKFEAAKVAVTLADPVEKEPKGFPRRRCVGCGDCVTGCNYFAKNTLTTNYLPWAKEAGARMFTGVTVLDLAPVNGAVGQAWKIRFVRTVDRGSLRKYREATPKVTLDHELYAKTVILSAGSLGSTEILVRSKERNGLWLSDKLGHQFSGNGDYLAFGYLQKKVVQGVGWGSRGDASGASARIGPTITGMIKIEDEKHLDRCALIEEGSVPGALARVFHEMVTTMASVSQLKRESYCGESAKNPPVDPLALQPEALTHTQTLLAMGHDGAGGILRYENDKDKRQDRLKITWPHLEKVSLYKTHDERLRYVESLGAIYLQNPTWSPLPESVGNSLSGPALGNGTFTVHPLGGCPMGDSVRTGVVDENGAVYEKSGEPYKGLYVLDGSIIPCALGVNPLLTITALAERAMEKISLDPPRPSSHAEKKEPLTFPKGLRPGPRYANTNGDRLALQFTEVLRGKLLYRDERDERSASLILHLPVADLQRFFESPSHPIEILGSQGYDPEGLAAEFRIEGPQGPRTPVEEFKVASGTVEIFERHAPRRLHRWSAILRVVLTWYIERGHDELCRVIRNGIKRGLGIGRRPVSKSKVSFLRMVRDWWRLVKHATESRIFTYGINLRRQGRTFYLHGVKRFEYAASCAALFGYVWAWMCDPDNKPYLQRPNVWTSLGLLDVKLYDEDRTIVAQGSLSMDVVDMTHRHAAQLALKRDSGTALLAFAGYPLMFLRSMIKTRLWDFRLPDYPEARPAELSPRGQRVPVPEAETDSEAETDPKFKTAWPKFPRLRKSSKHDEVDPDYLPELNVQRSRWDETKDVTVRLTRYRQGKLHAEKMGCADQGMTQVKAIMLMNGFAQPTLPFVATEIPQNLAEYFYDLGYDVWLFDYRTSTILDSSKKPCTMDDIAEFDIPAAVEKIREELCKELKDDPATPCIDQSTLQIYAFAHCVGSACMAMSMLGGHLERNGRSMIAGVIFSQMQAFLIGSETAQIRIPVGSALRDVAGVDVVHLAASEVKPTAFESLLDRLGATLPMPGAERCPHEPDAERCPHENDRVVDRPDIATCKRLSVVISRLFKHERLREETHRKLDVYFGRANTSLLVHGTKCLDYEQLVNADGQNVYVTDANIQRYFKLPIALLHGRENALFNQESCGNTYKELARVNGWPFARKYYRRMRIAGFAHFDCIVGKDVHEKIFPKLKQFLDRAWTQNCEGIHRADPGPESVKWEDYASRVAAPVTGPIVGRVQTDGQKSKVRLWIQVNEYEQDPAWCAMTVVRHPGSADEVKTWPITRIALEREKDGPADDALIPPGVGYVAIAIADLELLPLNLDDPGYDIDMVSLHVSPRDDAQGTNSGRPAKNQRIRGMRPGVLATRRIKEANLVPVRLMTETPPSKDDLKGDPLIWIHWIKKALWETGPLTKEIPPEEAKRMLAALEKSTQETRKRALGPNPGTLSRKRRRLPREDVWTAHIKPQTLAGPRADGTLRFLAGCCRYPGMTFEAKRADATFKYVNELLERERDGAHRDFMFMLGDQIYADATAGLFDPRSSVEKFRVRYEQAFSSPEFRKLARQLPLYMVIDDHEIDNDWSGDEFAKGPEARRLFFTAMSSFAAYQWAHSPRNVDASGFNYEFEAGGYRFLVLDTRTQRKRHHQPAVLAEDQMGKLESWLAEAGTDKEPKFIVTGSVLAPGLSRADRTLPDAAVDSWQMAQEQRRRVLRLLREHNTQNVVFLSGDYHCAATAKLEFAKRESDKDLKAYAIVSPPFYAPYTYANVQPDKVMYSEDIDLVGDSVKVTARATGGNGFSDIRVDRLAGGKWALEISTYALSFEDETPNFMPSTRAFVLD